MNLFQIIKNCYKKTADFKGRSKRSEYWTFIIFVYSIYIGSFMLVFVNDGFIFFAIIWGLFNVITCLSLTIRRLHDLNLSGWFLLIPMLISGIGSAAGSKSISAIVFIGMKVLYMFPGFKGKNKYGPDLKN